MKFKKSNVQYKDSEHDWISVFKMKTKFCRNDLQEVSVKRDKPERLITRPTELVGND